MNVSRVTALPWHHGGSDGGKVSGGACIIISSPPRGGALRDSLEVHAIGVVRRGGGARMRTCATFVGTQVGRYGSRYEPC